MGDLAKLSRPRLARVRPRERLLARLDECRSAACVWIGGPPGSGKTTLVANHLSARKPAALWYQVDPGDADPASVFYHLGLGARRAGLARTKRLPLLTPEYLGDVPGFARRYFRGLFQGLPRPWVLVLDNFQQAPKSAPFAAVVREALIEAPEGVQVLVTSRTPPPPLFARLRATGALVELGWDELRLTDAEAREIAAAALPGDAPAAERLAARCDGWAAGLTLLLHRGAAAGPAGASTDSRQALFDYIAAELFDDLPADTRRLLLHTAMLPWVGAEAAVRLSDNEQAPAQLEALRRKHLFVERRDGALPTYRYHDLFREFLAARAQDSLPPDEHRALALRSARLLEAAGDPDEALRLFRLAADTDAAVTLVLAQAPRLAAQGRIQTLAGWIGALPPATAAALPWLGYWLAMCRLGADPADARARLEDACERFRRAGDGLGETLAAAGVVDSFYVEFGDFSPADPWVDRLCRLLDAGQAFPDPGLELTVLSQLLGMVHMRQHRLERLQPYAQRIRALIDGTADASTRLMGAAKLLMYQVFHQPAEAGRRLIEHMRPLLDDPGLSALSAGSWLHAQAFHHWFSAFDAAASRQALDAALARVERDGLGPFAGVLRSISALFHLGLSELDAAEAELASIDLIEGRRFDLGWYDGVCAWLAMRRGQFDRALACAQRVVEYSTSSGATVSLGMALMIQANALGAAGRYPQAFDCLRRARPNLLAAPFDPFSIALFEADLYLAVGDRGTALALVQQAFGLGREERLLNTRQWVPAQMSRLCAFALEHGVETEYVGWLIRRRGLRPPSPDAAGWPWPVRVRCLGRFELQIDGDPLPANGKAQRKPLALLKALIAHGGRDVPQDRLIDAVWTEPLDGDEQKAIDVTVHRLRKLLKHDKAVHVGDRRVGLDPDLVWVDLWSLERHLGELGAVAGGPEPPPAELERAAPAVLALAGGPFLGEEPASAWLLPMRNRLNSRFERFVKRLGEQRERTGRWSSAADLYERAVELDPLAEAFYRRWMVCLREQGRRAEAIEVFRRCRQMLSVTLGTVPAEQTEALYRDLIAPTGRATM